MAWDAKYRIKTYITKILYIPSSFIASCANLLEFWELAHRIASLLTRFLTDDPCWISSFHSTPLAFSEVLLVEYGTKTPLLPLR